MALIKVVLANLNPWIFYISHPAMITAGMTLLTMIPAKAMVSAASIVVVVGITRVVAVELIWVKDNCLWFLTPASWMMR
jgi:hypothetical protein